MKPAPALGSHGRLFGGLIAAQALAATCGTGVAGGRAFPQSLHAYFIQGGRVGVDVDYTVETTRDGRSFDTRRVTGRPGGRADLPDADVLSPSGADPGLAAAQPLRLPFENATTTVTPPEEWVSHFEVRVAAEVDTDWPLQPFWFRSRERVEDDPLLQACAMTFVSDLGLVSTGRPPGHQTPGPGGAASLDHALWLHRPIDVNEWHCYDASAVSHSDARGLAFGSIHDHADRLVASVAQESLWRI